MLQDTLEFFETLNLKYEVIVVNDGSKDKTSEVAMKFK